MFFFSDREKDFQWEDTCDAREMAVNAAFSRWPHAEVVYTGVGVAADLDFICSDLGDVVLEAVRRMGRTETAAARGWLRNVDGLDLEALDAKLKEVLIDFITINGYAPDWVTVEQIRKHRRGLA